MNDNKKVSGLEGNERRHACMGQCLGLGEMDGSWCWLHWGKAWHEVAAKYFVAFTVIR
jgi:hypothetical protein